MNLNKSIRSWLHHSLFIATHIHLPGLFGYEFRLTEKELEVAPTTTNTTSSSNITDEA